ncbi:MAG: M50 family metallopeptidase [Clostridia bacterium]
MLTVITTVLMLGLLILVHEAGHFLVARRSGVLCHEFSIGFGPLLYSWEGSETTYSLRAIPLGGYVLMAGETASALEGEPPPDDEVGRRMTDKPVGTRAAIMAAGPLTNVILAFLVFFLIYAAVGVPYPSLTVNEVQEGYPAESSGIEVGDRIVAVSGEPVEEWMDVVTLVRGNPGETLTVTVERDGTTSEFELTPTAVEEAGETFGYAGIGSETEQVRFPITTSLLQALSWTFTVILLLGRTIGEILVGTTGTDQLMGVVGIGAEVGRATQMGLASVLSLAGSISASVGFINLLPLPVLDGGRLLLLGVEAVSGNRLDPQKEGLINLVGVALLILLALYVTVQDVLRLSG